MMITKMIGKGAFTRAYLMSSGRVLLKSCCPIKECMSMGWFPDSPLFPVLLQVDVEVYEMDYYPKQRSLKNALQPEHWQTYKTLKAAYDQGCLSLPKNIHDAYQHWYNVFEQYLDGELQETMLEALGACANCGSDIGFEISPRNVAVNSAGELVLLDVFFSHSKLKEVRRK